MILPQKWLSFFLFMEGVHLPHSQVSWGGEGTFHQRVDSYLNRDSKLNFLVNSVSSMPKRFLVESHIYKKQTTEQQISSNFERFYYINIYSEQE